ncbi:Protein of unknown function [Propionibacterium freudenreichii]|nr:Protein of unknown function [Propionibacterium freudenreichii]CEG98346.1 Protein of unknown function [Propionibacterium freudenreichii]CEH03397.1 Protein of unknown function [Propionibacterium freudenreichii]
MTHRVTENDSPGHDE